MARLTTFHAGLAETQYVEGSDYMTTSRTNDTVLVTGATGQTGSKTVELLLAEGLNVRALVHSKDERAAKLASAGAEVVVGDLHDLDAVDHAVAGARAAYFVYPIESGLIHATCIFAQAATDADLEAVVNMSQISARRDAKSNAAREHWLAERLLDWFPVSAVHLRPTFFAEWLTIFADPVAQADTLRLPMGDGRHAPITSDDQARVIAAILADPQPHLGKTYPLYGPTEMNHDEIAQVMSEVLGRTIRYDPMDDEAFVRLLQDGGRSPHRVQHLRNVIVDYRNGVFAGTNDNVERIGKKAPTTVAQYIEQNRQSFMPRR
jgi:NAD(P)H dehydrogenase (quinone)